MRCSSLPGGAAGPAAAALVESWQARVAATASALAAHVEALRVAADAYGAAERAAVGALEDRPDEVELELRASWTPQDADLEPHLTAWGTLLCTTAGLPPMPDGVSILGRRR